MYLYASLWFLIDPYKFLCVLMDSNGSLWVLGVLIGLYACLCVLMGPYWSLLVFMHPCVSLWVLIIPYAS